MANSGRENSRYGLGGRFATGPGGIDVPEDKIPYLGIDKVVLIVEDETPLRESLERAARLRFAKKADAQIYAVSSVPLAVSTLEDLKTYSPDARLAWILDYNMGRNVEGQKKPIEALFFPQKGEEGAFHYFLKRGGLIILNTGYPEQVLGSKVIMDSPKEYGNIALFVSRKGAPEIDLSDLMNLAATSFQNPERIQQWRKAGASTKYNHDLAKILGDLKGRR